MQLFLINKYFTLLVGLSVAISILYIAGYKHNIKLMKLIAESLENALTPRDKLYTYLGGVLGFAVDYDVDGFKKVHATLRLIPRQSILYLPFVFLTNRKDSLQLMFYTKNPIKSEFHLIKESVLDFFTKPKIYNRNKLKSKIVEIEGKKWEMLYEDETYHNFINLINFFNSRHFKHLAITKENNIVYIKLEFYKIDYKSLTTSIQKAKKFIEAAV